MTNTRVYFIGSKRSRAVKIGVAEDVRTRLSGNQVGNHQRLVVLADMPGDERYEHALHEAFAEYRIRGEWFRHEGRLAQFIALLPVFPRIADSLRATAQAERRVQKAALLAEAKRAGREVERRYKREVLPLICDAIRDYGVDEFAKLVGARRGDIVRAMSQRGRYIRVEWLMRLGAAVPRETALAILTPLMDIIGLRVLTPEQVAAEDAARAETERIRALMISTYGEIGRQALAQLDAEIAAEEAQLAARWAGAS
jgi:hypothetical protein